VLSRCAQLRSVWQRIGDLYATNTLGAVIGQLPRFYLIPSLGMRTTVYVAAAVNLIIAGDPTSTALMTGSATRADSMAAPAQPAGAGCAPL
jgi:predicted membrane-bound spermidine synthase